MIRTNLVALALAALVASPAPATAQARKAAPRPVDAWTRAYAVLEEHANRPKLILALKDRQFDEASAMARSGSFFGVLGLTNQRHYLKAHLQTLRYLCRSIEGIAPQSFFEGNVIRFAGKPDRRTGEFTYFIDNGDANAVTGLKDAQLVTEELGCAAATPYAKNVYEYLLFKEG